MTNGEKYKTAKERGDAFASFCTEECSKCKLEKYAAFECSFTWLDLEAEEEKPMPCPFCGGNELRKVSDIEGYVGVECICNYQTQRYKTYAEAIAAHNRVCQAVAAYKKSEVE